MGQAFTSQPFSSKISGLDLNNWKIKCRLSNGITIWTHSYRDLQLMEIVFHVQQTEDYEQLKEMYQYRYHNDLLVATMNWMFRNSNSKGFCGKQYKGSIFYERLLTTLAKVKDIPFPDSLHFYSNAFQGLGELYRKFGYFTLSQEMFHINHRNQVKVWIDYDISKIIPTHKGRDLNKTESDMLSQAIILITQNCDKCSQLTQLLQRYLVKAHTFQEAYNQLKQFCKTFNYQVADRLNCLNNINTSQYANILDEYCPDQEYQISQNFSKNTHDGLVTFSKLPTFGHSPVINQEIKHHPSNIIFTHHRNPNQVHPNQYRVYTRPPSADNYYVSSQPINSKYMPIVERKHYSQQKVHNSLGPPQIQIIRPQYMHMQAQSLKMPQNSHFYQAQQIPNNTLQNRRYTPQIKNAQYAQNFENSAHQRSLHQSLKKSGANSTGILVTQQKQQLQLKNTNQISYPQKLVETTHKNYNPNTLSINQSIEPTPIVHSKLKKKAAVNRKPYHISHPGSKIYSGLQSPQLTNSSLKFNNLSIVGEKQLMIKQKQGYQSIYKTQQKVFNRINQSNDINHSNEKNPLQLSFNPNQLLPNTSTEPKSILINYTEGNQYTYIQNNNNKKYEPQKTKNQLSPVKRFLQNKNSFDDALNNKVKKGTLDQKKVVEQKKIEQAITDWNKKYNNKDQNELEHSAKLEEYKRTADRVSKLLNNSRLSPFKDIMKEEINTPVQKYQQKYFKNEFTPTYNQQKTYSQSLWLQYLKEKQQKQKKQSNQYLSHQQMIAKMIPSKYSFSQDKKQQKEFEPRYSENYLGIQTKKVWSLSELAKNATTQISRQQHGQNSYLKKNINDKLGQQRQKGSPRQIQVYDYIKQLKSDTKREDTQNNNEVFKLKYQTQNQNQIGSPSKSFRFPPNNNQFQKQVGSPSNRYMPFVNFNQMENQFVTSDQGSFIPIDNLSPGRTNFQSNYSEVQSRFEATPRSVNYMNIGNQYPVKKYEPNVDPDIMADLAALRQKGKLS